MYRILIAMCVICCFAVIYCYVCGRRKRRAETAPTALPDMTWSELLSRIKEEVYDIQRENDQTDELRRSESERLRSATLEACLGDRGDREYVRDTIRDILTSKLGINDTNIGFFIPFGDPDRMTAQDKFEHLYSMLAEQEPHAVFSEMVRRYHWDIATGVVTDEDIDCAYRTRDIKSTFSDRLDCLVQRCYQLIYGHDCVDLLITDSSVDGVSGGVGGQTRVEYDYLAELTADSSSEGRRTSRSCDIVFCMFNGCLIRLGFLSFGNDLRLERVVRNICRYNTRIPLSQKDPVLCGNLKDNSRVVVARPPVSDGWAFYVRKFTTSQAADITRLLVHQNADTVIFLLKTIVEAEFNMVISGNTGGGKTTLLKSLISFVDPHYTLRVVETSFELNLNNLYPERNVHVLQERGEFTVYDAITATKKMDTDVLIIGEVNEPKVAGAYIQIAQSGSRMALTTLHHETTQDLVEYLRNALVTECGISNVAVAERQVIGVLRFDVHMIHDMSGNRYIERITEIIPNDDPEYPAGEADAAREFYRRMTEHRSYACRDIVVFDKASMSYRSMGLLTPTSSARIEARLGKERVDELRRRLCSMNCYM